MARLGLEVAACYTSPLVRARQTAELACRSLDVEPEEREVLGKEFDEAAARELLLEHDDGARVLIVGHDPTFTQVVPRPHGRARGHEEGRRGGALASPTVRRPS